jgi:FkbM family methyltransferase
MEGALDWLAARHAYVVVQIGAYVGDTANDPLYGFLRATLPDRPQSLAVLVEPVHEYFAALRDAYGDLPTVRLENVAIAEEEGVRDFYRLAPGLEHGDYGWLAQLGSLRRERMTDLWDRYEGFHSWDEPKNFWHQHHTVEKVQCWTLEQLLERHGLERVDLLQIDAEGYDYEILRTIDFSRLRPRFINYERVLLQEDEPTCREMLRDAGYALFDWGQDTLAVALAR